MDVVILVLYKMRTVQDCCQVKIQKISIHTFYKFLCLKEPLLNLKILKICNFSKQTKMTTSISSEAYGYNSK